MEMQNFERARLRKEMISLLPQLRKALHISQEECAQRIGISRQMFCAYETGKANLTWSTFLALYLFFSANESSFAVITSRRDFRKAVEMEMKLNSAND